MRLNDTGYMSYQQQTVKKSTRFLPIFAIILQTHLRK